MTRKYFITGEAVSLSARTIEEYSNQTSGGWTRLHNGKPAVPRRKPRKFTRLVMVRVECTPEVANKINSLRKLSGTFRRERRVPVLRLDVAEKAEKGEWLNWEVWKDDE